MKAMPLYKRFYLKVKQKKGRKEGRRKEGKTEREKGRKKCPWMGETFNCIWDGWG